MAPDCTAVPLPLRRRPAAGVLQGGRRALAGEPDIFAVPKADGETHKKLGALKGMAYGFANAESFGARGLLLCPGSGHASGQS